MMIALPPFASEILAALVAAVASLVFVKRRPTFTINTGHDHEREYKKIENRVRHPFTYKVRNWLR